MRSNIHVHSEVALPSIQSTDIRQSIAKLRRARHPPGREFKRRIEVGIDKMRDRDLRLARYWYDVAARNGDEAGPGKVKELDARLAAEAGS